MIVCGCLIIFKTRSILFFVFTTPHFPSILTANIELDLVSISSYIHGIKTFPLLLSRIPYLLSLTMIFPYFMSSYTQGVISFPDLSILPCQSILCYIIKTDTIILDRGQLFSISIYNAIFIIYLYIKIKVIFLFCEDRRIASIAVYIIVFEAC